MNKLSLKKSQGLMVQNVLTIDSFFKTCHYNQTYLQYQTMFQVINKKEKKNNKIEPKGQGVSTKNYVSFESQQKRWVKKKVSSEYRRDQFQCYVYSNILSFNKKTLANQSLFNSRDVTIQIDLKSQESGLLQYYIERPVADQSMKELFKHHKNEKYVKYSLLKHLPQILQIYLQQSLNPLPVITPLTLIAKKNWNQTNEIFLNSTSLVGYHFLLQKSQILYKKFKQIMCYIHPKLIHLQQFQNKIDFQCQLFSFAMNLLSIILEKQISLPIFNLRNKITITLQEAQHYLKKNVEQMRQLINSEPIKNELKRADKNQNYQKNHFFSFFENVFSQNKCTFKTWSQVCSYFYPHYFSYFEENISEKMLEVFKQRYCFESKEEKQLYSTMGLIHCSENEQDLNKRQLFSYILVKYQALNMIRFKSSTQTFFNPEFYILMKRIQQEVLQFQRNKKEGKEKQTDSELEDFQFRLNEEIVESKNFNIYSYQLEEQQNNEHQTIYVVNDFQETLNIYQSSLWL